MSLLNDYIQKEQQLKQLQEELQRLEGDQRLKSELEFKAKLEALTAAMLQHATECCVCKVGFERTKETVATWQVTIRENRIRLTCPDCWSTIKKVVESKDED